MSANLALNPPSNTGLGKPTRGQPKVSQPEVSLPFAEWSKKRIAWMDMENKNEQWKRWRKWEEVNKFFIGEQLIWWNGNIMEGYWKGVELEEGDPYYASNIFADYVNAVVAELSKSDPQLRVDSKTDQVHMVDAAMAAKIALINEERRVWTAEQKLRMLYFLLLYGNAFLYTCWQPDSGPMIQMPDFQNQPMSIGHQYAGCPQCGGTTPMQPQQGNSQSGQIWTPDMAGQQMPPTAEAPAPPCKDCGNPNTQVMGQANNINMPQFGAPKQQRGGDVGLVIPDPSQIKIHLHGRCLEESPYIAWTQYLLLTTAQKTWGYHQFAPGAANYERDHRQIERDQEGHPGNMTGMGGMGDHGMSWGISGASDKDFVRVRRYWQRPEEYWNYITPEAIELDSGLTIPANTAFREVFPDGLYMPACGDEVLDMDNRAIDDEWVHIPYRLIVSRIWGDGSESMVQQQREYNELRSLKLENAFNNATPSTYYNPRKVKKGTISAKSRQVVPLDNAKDGDNPADYIWVPPARELGGSIDAMEEQIKNDMQLHSTAPIAGSGLNGVDSSTATGMQIQRDWTNSKLSVHTDLIVSGKLKRARQHLKLVQKFWTGDRYIKISDENGIEDGRWFKSADIQGEFDITYLEGSWQPRSTMELMNNLMQLLVAGGVPFGGLNPAFPKPALKILTRTLGIPLDVDGYSVHVKKQRKEIDAMKQTVTTGMQFGLPPEAVGSVQVEENDNDQVHIDTCYAYLNSELGQQEQPQTKAVILQHVAMHKQSMMMKQFQQMQLSGGMMPGQPGQPGQPNGQAGGQPPGQQQGQPPPQQSAGGNNQPPQRGQ